MARHVVSAAGIDVEVQTYSYPAFQPHLLKIFHGIKRLESSTATATDVVGVESAEGGHIALAKHPKAPGEVEKWLSVLEQYPALARLGGGCGLRD